MKSLEKVIKLKNRVIDVKKPEGNRISEVFTQHHTGKKLIYSVKNLNNKNSIQLVQQITPLIYHLISRFKNEEENLFKKLVINLVFPSNKKLLNFSRGFKINDENPLNSIKEFIKYFKTEGYFITFTKHFNRLILLKTENLETIEPKTEEPETIENLEEWVTNFMLPDCVKRRMEEIAYGAMAKQQMETRKERINLEKSFKSGECVIWLTNLHQMFYLAIVDIYLYV